MLRILHEDVHGIPPVALVAPPRAHAPLPRPRVHLLIQAGYLLGALTVKVEFGHGHAHALGELVVVGPASQLVHQYPFLDANVVDLFDGALGDADRAGLFADVALYLLLDPPYGVGGEAKAQLRIEFFRGAREADDALLAGVLELDGIGALGLTKGGFFGCLTGDGDDESEVGLDEGRLGALGTADLLFEAGDGVVGGIGPLGEGGGTQ
mmetsp:Transcript_20872/g.43997  ORF Transcript_20872/g.43997 Transcript_20872/m.43997 type:complete len:209 (-) Transcript_20872:1397-2023(-)